MFFYGNVRTLYLNNWEYNAMLIMEELRKIVTDNGGRIKEQKGGEIVKRTLLNEIRETEEKIERVTANIESGEARNPETAGHYLQTLKKELEELKAIPNEPRKVSGGSYLEFVIADNHIYLQFEENPFFPFYYRKTAIKDGKFSRDAGGDELDKSFLWDCFLSTTKPATDDDRREAANLIFNQLMTAGNSKIIRDSRRERVHNIHNSGYHYETILAPERFGVIDF